jgi:hypothetical protein
VCVLALKKKVFFSKQMMLPDSPQNIVVVRAPSPSIHYLPGSMNGDNVLPTQNQQQTNQQPINSFSQPVSESWCLTSVKVIKVSEENIFFFFYLFIYLFFV